MSIPDWRNTLKRIRKERGKSQSDIALHLGKTQQTIANWESGKADPSMGELISYTNLIGISMSDLFSNVHLNERREGAENTEQCPPNCPPNSPPNEQNGNLKGNPIGNLNVESTGNRTDNSTGNFAIVIQAKDQVIQSQAVAIQALQDLLNTKTQEVIKLTEENERLKRAVPEVGEHVADRSGGSRKKNIA